MREKIFFSKIIFSNSKFFLGKFSKNVTQCCRLPIKPSEMAEIWSQSSENQKTLSALYKKIMRFFIDSIVKKKLKKKIYEAVGRIFEKVGKSENIFHQMTEK